MRCTRCCSDGRRSTSSPSTGTCTVACWPRCPPRSGPEGATWTGRRPGSCDVGDDTATLAAGAEASREDPPLATARANPGVWPGIAAAAGLYLAISLVLWARIWLTGSPAHSLTCPCGDVAEQLWWFEWLPRALQHAHNPFYSNAQFARFGGINAMTNTNLLLPAALLSPLTVLAGPIASSNLANLLAPVATGAAAYALAARFTRRTIARLVAGLAYAFSPFVMGNLDVGHLNLTLLAYTPLVLLVGDRLIRGETSPRRAGIALGLLTVGEALLGGEGIAITA